MLIGKTTQVWLSAGDRASHSAYCNKEIEQAGCRTQGKEKSHVGKNNHSILQRRIKAVKYNWIHNEESLNAAISMNPGKPAFIVFACQEVKGIEVSIFISISLHAPSQSTMQLEASCTRSCKIAPFSNRSIA